MQAECQGTAALSKPTATSPQSHKDGKHHISRVDATGLNDAHGLVGADKQAVSDLDHTQAECHEAAALTDPSAMSPQSHKDSKRTSAVLMQQC